MGDGQTNARPLAGREGVTTFPNSTFTVNANPPAADWCVLVLYADDTETNILGIWGPYTNYDYADAALTELRTWPLDGRWDVRRLNKFVAAKSGNTPNGLNQWTWQQ